MEKLLLSVLSFSLFSCFTLTSIESNKDVHYDKALTSIDILYRFTDGGLYMLVDSLHHELEKNSISSDAYSVPDVAIDFEHLVSKYPPTHPYVLVINQTSSSETYGAYGGKKKSVIVLNATILAVDERRAIWRANLSLERHNFGDIQPHEFGLLARKLVLQLRKDNLLE